MVTESKITVLVVPPDENEPVTLKQIDNSVEGFQEVVGGYFGVATSDELNRLMPIRLGVRTVMVVDEDGRFKRLPINSRASGLYVRSPLVGTVFICGERLQSPMDFVSLTPEAVAGVWSVDPPAEV